jgi:hypothetical protein
MVPEEVEQEQLGVNDDAVNQNRGGEIEEAEEGAGVVGAGLEMGKGPEDHKHLYLTPEHVDTGADAGKKVLGGERGDL